MTSLVLDADRSRVRVRTFAEGLFSRLAHDLELVCGELRGTATSGDDGLGTATVEAPIAAIAIGGTLKGERVDPDGVSRSDREEILEKMRREVFRVGPNDGAIVRVEATLTERRRARVRVVPPRGPAMERTFEVALAEGPRVSGTFALSIAGLGGGTVKGPMNAFRVKDAVEVRFDLAWRVDEARDQPA